MIMFRELRRRAGPVALPGGWDGGRPGRAEYLPAARVCFDAD